MEVARNRESLSFSRAIREGRQRVSNARRPPGVHRTFSYVERGFYSKEIERILNYFLRCQVLFVTRLELLNSQRLTLDSICTFLGVPAFRRYPVPEIIHSYATKIPSSPSAEDVRYLRTLFEDDLEVAESLINRPIEQEYL